MEIISHRKCDGNTSFGHNLTILLSVWIVTCQCNISLPDTGSCYSIRISKS